MLRNISVPNEKKKVSPGLLACLELQKGLAITGDFVHPPCRRIMQSVRSHQTPTVLSQSPNVWKAWCIIDRTACGPPSAQLFVELQRLQQQGRRVAPKMHSVRPMGGRPMNKLLFVQPKYISTHNEKPTDHPGQQGATFARKHSPVGEESCNMS